MAEKKFNKGSEEWLMFTDFWDLCQKHWELEEKQSYIEECIDACEKFVKKYNSIPLAHRLSIAFLDSIEDRRRK